MFATLIFDAFAFLGLFVVLVVGGAAYVASKAAKSETVKSLVSDLKKKVAANEPKA